MWTRLFVWFAALAAVVVGSVAVEPAPARSHDAILVMTTDDEMVIDGDCALREAIRAANTNTSYDFCSAGVASGDPDVVVLLEGTYNLMLAGAGEDGNMTGDLDVTGDTQFIGPGVAGAVINGNGIDRVLDVHSGSVQIIGIGIQGGEISGAGAGIRAASPLSVENVVISGNTASAAGGGIASDATLTMVTTAVTGNDGSLGGGIANTGSASIENSTLSGNIAGIHGGGLYNCGTATLTNDTISGNTADIQGGGIYEGCDLLTLTNVTIANNEASEGATAGAGGVFVDVQSGGSAPVKNTIISGNTGVNCLGDGITSLGNNLEEGPTLDEPTLCNFDAQGDVVQGTTSLGPLADNDGVTQTHALLANSPAVDGASDDCPPPTGDQRNLLRPIDGDNDGDPLCDIGAFEFEPSAPPPSPTPTEVPPTNVVVDVTVSDNSPDVGDTVDVSVTVTDDAGNPRADVACSFDIIDQPGDDAVLESDTGTTDASGVATVGLDVGSTPGTIQIATDCGGVTEVLEVVVSAAGLPETGASGTPGSSGNVLVVALAVLAAATVLGSAGYALRRR